MEPDSAFDRFAEANERYLDWVKDKHAADSDFADKFVAALREEFGRHPPLTDDNRATLYARVRLRLDSVRVSARGLKSLAKREINS